MKEKYTKEQKEMMKALDDYQKGTSQLARTHAIEQASYIDSYGQIHFEE